jgi:hypothetical protein
MKAMTFEALDSVFQSEELDYCLTLTLRLLFLNYPDINVINSLFNYALGPVVHSASNRNQYRKH